MATELSRSFQNLRVSRRYPPSLYRSAAASRGPPRPESSALHPPVAVRLRNLATQSSIATTESASASTASDATTSGGEEKAGGSQQSSEAGKPVRGAPVSWLSFLLLVGTGLGIILYHDKGKKRHIEDINSSSKAVKQGPMT